MTELADLDDLVFDGVVDNCTTPTVEVSSKPIPAAVSVPPIAERELFYGSMPATDAQELRASADRVNAKMRGAVIEIGRELLKIRDRLPGRFDEWLRLEFNMSKSSAYNYINAMQQFGATPKVIEVLPPGTVYKLAAKATPPDVRDAVVKEIAGGATVAADDVERRIAEAKLKAREAKEAEQKRAAIERQRQQEERAWRIQEDYLIKLGRNQSEIEAEHKKWSSKKEREERARAEAQRKREAQAQAAQMEWQKKQDRRAKAASDAVEFLQERLGADFFEFQSLLEFASGHDFATRVKDVPYKLTTAESRF